MQKHVNSLCFGIHFWVNYNLVTKVFGSSYFGHQSSKNFNQVANICIYLYFGHPTIKSNHFGNVAFHATMWTIDNYYIRSISAKSRVIIITWHKIEFIYFMYVRK